MTANPDPKPLDLGMEQSIDSVCDRFEADFHADCQPQIEDYLEDSDGEKRLALLKSLLEVEVELLLRHGRLPSADSYQKRFPNHADVVAATYRRVTERAARAENGARGHSKTSVGVALGDKPTETKSFGDSASAGDTSRSAQATAPNETSATEEQIGRFQILSVLGQGAFGTVYHAHDPQLNREVAVKVPRTSTFATKETEERFLREAQAAANLRHPNICSVHEIGEIDSGYFIVMDFIAGKPLAAYLDPEKPLPEKQAAKIIRLLAAALASAHQKGIVHRDLKPANIMIDSERRQPVIMDFGLARFVQSDEAHLTQNGQVMGTPLYMSPEQARGDIDAVGPASDIYSLGVILYEMLCGRRPFEHPHAGVIIAQVQTDEAEPPSTHREGIDPQLETICLKAMSKKVEDRYVSMGELAAELAQYVKSREAANGSPSTKASPSASETEAPNDTHEAGLSLLFPALETKHSRTHSMRRRGRKNVWQSVPPVWKWTAGAAAAALLILLGIVIVVKTDKGTVTITFADARAAEKCTVHVDGRQIRIENLGKPITLTPGDYQLVVKHGDIEVETKRITIPSGEATAVVIEYTPVRVPGESPGVGATRLVANQAKGHQEARAKRSGVPVVETSSEPAIAQQQPVGRSAEEIAARRQEYLDRYLKPLLEGKTEDVSAEKYAASFPPNVKTEFEFSTANLTTKSFADRECKRPIDSDRVAEGKVDYFKGYYDSDGRLRQVECYGNDGGLKEGPMGCAIARYWYDDEGHRVQEAFFDTDGQPMENNRLVIVAHHAREGEHVERRFYDAQGQPAEDYCGVHRRVVRRGKATLEYRLDGSHRERWLPPLRLSRAINRGDACQPALTPDGRELYFSAWNGPRDTGFGAIHRAIWKGDHWSGRELVLAGDQPLTGQRPAISSDGNLMALVAWKEFPPARGVSGDYPDLPNYGKADIYFTERKNGVWQQVRNAGPEINTGDEDMGMAFVPGTHTLCVTRTVRRGVLRQLWLADREGDQWVRMRRFPFADADRDLDAMAPVFSPDGERLYFSSNRKGSYPREDRRLYADIWVSQKEGDAWSRPINLGTEVNGGAHEEHAAFLAAGDVMYFHCNAPHWHILVSGRADSEAAIRHMADIYNYGEQVLPPAPTEESADEAS